MMTMDIAHAPKVSQSCGSLINLVNNEQISKVKVFKLQNNEKILIFELKVMYATKRRLNWVSRHNIVHELDLTLQNFK